LLKKKVYRVITQIATSCTLWAGRREQSVVVHKGSNVLWNVNASSSYTVLLHWKLSRRRWTWNICKYPVRTAQ